MALDRRTFLLGGTALVAACGKDGESTRSTTRSLVGPTAGTADTGSASTAPGGIDLGPSMPAGVPRSLAAADRAELDVELNLLSGELPTDWHGHAHILHAIPYGDGTSVFVGDGKVVRLSMRQDGVHLRSRIVKTPCHVYDHATLGLPHGFENDGFARMSLKVGFRNFANTALVAMGDRLLVTSDAGRPYELDPDTLQVVTAVGRNEEWEGILPGFLEGFVDWVFPLHMTTAHPAVDPVTHELFTVNYGLALIGGSPDAWVMRWDGEGDLGRWRLVDAQGRGISITQSVHQVVLTERFVVLMDTAFVVEVGFGAGEPATVPQAPHAALHIVARSDLVDGSATVQAHTVVVPRESVHFAADYDDDDGIALLIAHNVAADPSEMVRQGDEGPDGTPVDPAHHGLPASATDIGVVGRYVIDVGLGQLVSGEVVTDDALWGGPALVAQAEAAPAKLGAMFWASAGVDRELQVRRIIDLYADHPHRTVALTDVPDRMPATLNHIDGASGQVVASWSFPDGRWGVSPCFVPRVGSSSDTDGYVVITVVSDDDGTEGSSGDELWVFDAADLAAGPIARLGHPDLSMPFTLHTLWMPTAEPRTATYRVDVEADHDIRGQSHAVKDVFESVVFPAFRS